MSLTDKNLILDLGKAIGMSEAEMKWMFARMKHLIHVDKKSKGEVTAIVKEEAKGKPWLS